MKQKLKMTDIVFLIVGVMTWLLIVTAPLWGGALLILFAWYLFG